MGKEAAVYDYSSEQAFDGPVPPVLINGNLEQVLC